MTIGGNEDLPEHVALNRAKWDEWAAEYAGPGERAWALAPGDETWGVFDVPEAEIHLLPDDLEGLDAIELGCGTGYVSAWMARRGARSWASTTRPSSSRPRPASSASTAWTSRSCWATRSGSPTPTPSFDFAISEYGAALWADPYAWVPEAARLLRPGGSLTMLTNGLLAYLTMPDIEADGPADEQLKRPLFGMHRTVWPDELDAVEFHLAHGDWIRLFRACGFEVEDLVELRAPEGATTSFKLIDAAWAAKWPCEEAWKVRKVG